MWVDLIYVKFGEIYWCNNKLSIQKYTDNVWGIVKRQDLFLVIEDCINNFPYPWLVNYSTPQNYNGNTKRWRTRRELIELRI